MHIRTAAPASRLQADTARRLISGQVVPWGTFAQVSTGQTVAFARGALQLSDRAKLVLDHDPGRPVGVYVSSQDTDAGLEAVFRVPAGPAGDAILAEAAEGLRDGLSVAADVVAGDETDGGLWVTAARGRHVALLSEPAFDTARVSSVTATAPTNGAPMETETVTTASSSPASPPPAPAPAAPVPAAVEASAEVVHLTAAGAAVPNPPAAAPARVQDPYPYAQPHLMGGPSFVRDAWAAMENPGSVEADRWRRAQVMLADPAVIRAGMAHIGLAGARPAPELAAATGTTTTDPALVPPRWQPERYVALRGAKAPLYTALTKYPTPDFTTIEVPRTLTETGLSGTPADEVTPIAPGDITTGNDTVTIAEVEGAYSFSRKLLMGANPAIDRIASDAMDRAWLADVETRAVAFFTAVANSTAWASTYADGIGFVGALRGVFASMAAGTLYQASDVIPATKEYQAAAGANDTTGRALLPYGPQVNSSGESGAGYGSVTVQGVPLHPGPYMPANKTLVLDQSLSAATCFATPVQNFRLEWTTDATTGGNVKVLKLVKYSGIGFWSQYRGGVILITNTTPITAEDGAEDSGDTGSTRGAKK